MCSIVTAFIQCQDGDEVYAGLWNVECISEFKCMPIRDAELDIAHANGIHSCATQSFHRATRSGPEVLEV